MSFLHNVFILFINVAARDNLSSLLMLEVPGFVEKAEELKGIEIDEIINVSM